MNYFISDQLTRRMSSVQTNPMKHCTEYGRMTLRFKNSSGNRTKVNSGTGCFYF